MSQDRDPPRVFGHIPGYKSGHIFKDRQELKASGVHVPIRHGIYHDSESKNGAFSICLSREGYEDDKDYGDRITFVGTGGQDKTKKQIKDQSFNNVRNKALVISCQTRKPVRVIRGANKDNPWAPPFGYEYDGLYVVDSFKMEQGKAGYQMCFFELRRIEDDHAQAASPPKKKMKHTD